MPRLIHRRDFIQAGAISSAALATHPLDGILTQHLDGHERAVGSESFWQNGARLVIPVSMQMEAGAQPLSGALLLTHHSKNVLAEDRGEAIPAHAQLPASG